MRWPRTRLDFKVLSVLPYHLILHEGRRKTWKELVLNPLQAVNWALLLGVMLLRFFRLSTGEWLTFLTHYEFWPKILADPSGTKSCFLQEYFLKTYSLRKKIAFYKNLKFRNLPESHSQASSDSHYSATDEPTSASSKDVVEAASNAIQSGKQSWKVGNVSTNSSVNSNTLL